MNTIATVIINSSDEECDNPTTKKVKVSNGIHEPADNIFHNFQILDVKSLAKPIKTETNSDIVIIDESSSDDEKNENLTPKLDTNVMDDDICKENNKTKRRVALTAISKTKGIDAKDNVQSNDVLCENVLSSSSAAPSSNVSCDFKSNDEKPYCKEFIQFIDVCLDAKCSDNHKQLISSKIDFIKKKYQEADEAYIESREFLMLLRKTCEKIKKKPESVLLNFNDVYLEISEQKVRSDLVLSEKDLRHLRILRKAKTKIHKKIKLLETTEVDYDLDNNSAYIMEARYKARLCSIYEKECEILRKDSYKTRTLFKKLDVSTSQYSEINKAVEKYYRNYKKFPSYYDIDQIVNKCMEQHKDLILSDPRVEALKVFKEVGEILQRRRKYEVYESFSEYIDEMRESDEDPELEKKLDENYVETEKKINQIIDEYANKTPNDDEDLSSDSDNSNYKSDVEYL